MKDNLSNIPELNLDNAEHFYVVGTKNRDGVLAGNYKVDIKKGSESDDNTSVLRTTPQELTHEQKEVALSNLGVYPLAGVPEEHQIRCSWDFDCETHCFDSNTLDAIKSIPDGESSDDPTYKYFIYSDDYVYCIVGGKTTEDGYIYIDLYPYVEGVNFINTLEGLFIGYTIDESTGEVTDYIVRDGSGDNSLSVLKSSMIVMFTNQQQVVTNISVQYKGFNCYSLAPAILLTLLYVPAISFTGMLPNYRAYSDWQDFVFTVDGSYKCWMGVSLGAVAVSEGKLFAGAIG